MIGGMPLLTALHFPDESMARTWSHPGIVVSTTAFREHVRLLAAHFHVLSLPEFLDHLEAGGTFPPRSCLITFDDLSMVEHMNQALLDSVAQLEVAKRNTYDLLRTAAESGPNAVVEGLAHHLETPLLHVATISASWQRSPASARSRARPPTRSP